MFVPPRVADVRRLRAKIAKAAYAARAKARLRQQGSDPVMADASGVDGNPSWVTCSVQLPWKAVCGALSEKEIREAEMRAAPSLSKDFTYGGHQSVAVYVHSRRWR